MKTTVRGIHHITAISGPAQKNYQFYTEVLGLNLVKKTVNFDDPGVYHLYYGDHRGSPGTLITFFPYGGSQGRQGAGQVTTTCYPVEDLEATIERLRHHQVECQETSRFGVRTLTFRDPDDMGLELYQGNEGLARIGGAILTVAQTGPTRQLLEFLGLEKAAEAGATTRMQMPNGDFLDLVEMGRPQGFSGPGTVHHIALRVADDAEQLDWHHRLQQAGYRVSPVMDRNYFHSIYFRGPGGILFELATDPPGMMVDEPVEELGKNLMLPPQFESHRALIEKNLEPLERPAVEIGTSVAR